LGGNNGIFRAKKAVIESLYNANFGVKKEDIGHENGYSWLLN
jgi:hypothetical protein